MCGGDQGCLRRQPRQSPIHRGVPNSWHRIPKAGVETAGVIVQFVGRRGVNKVANYARVYARDKFKGFGGDK